MKKHLIHILKLFLPLIFIAYLGGITLFTHSHVVNGVIIVHSHPFKGEHQHTEVELETIFFLSSFAASGSLFTPSSTTVFWVFAVFAGCAGCRTHQTDTNRLWHLFARASRCLLNSIFLCWWSDFPLHYLFADSFF